MEDSGDLNPRDSSEPTRYPRLRARTQMGWGTMRSGGG